MPRYLDEPWKIAFLTVDECAVLALPILFGIFIMNAPVVSLCIGSILVSLIKKLKGEEGHYFIRHLMYWHLPQIFYLRATPPSCQREFLG